MISRRQIILATPALIFPSAVKAWPRKGSGSGALIINPTYDTNSQPGGSSFENMTIQTGFYAAVAEAIGNFQRRFCRTPLTLGIQFGYGTKNNVAMVGGALGESDPVSVTTYSYSSVRAALLAKAVTANASAFITNSVPSGSTGPLGESNVFMRIAQAMQLGLDSAAAPHGYIGLGSQTQTGVTWAWSQSTVVGGTGDAVGVLGHEIGEVLGRWAVLPYSPPFSGPYVLNWAMYASVGTRATAYAANQYISSDGGATNINSGGQVLQTSSDAADLSSTGIDVAGSFASGGVQAFSNGHNNTMDLSGWQWNGR